MTREEWAKETGTRYFCTVLRKWVEVESRIPRGATVKYLSSYGREEAERRGYYPCETLEREEVLEKGVKTALKKKTAKRKRIYGETTWAQPVYSYCQKYAGGEISIEDACELAGVSRGGFQAYFAAWRLHQKREGVPIPPAHKKSSIPNRANIEKACRARHAGEIDAKEAARRCGLNPQAFGAYYAKYRKGIGA